MVQTLNRIMREIEYTGICTCSDSDSDFCNWCDLIKAVIY